MTYLSQRLATESEQFHLECLCELNGAVIKDAVWLKFTELKSREYKDQELVWDATNYLVNEFLPFLYRYRVGNLFEGTDVKVCDKEEYEDIWDYLDMEKVEDLIELFETARKLNWL